MFKLHFSQYSIVALELQTKVSRRFREVLQLRPFPGWKCLQVLSHLRMLEGTMLNWNLRKPLCEALVATQHCVTSDRREYLMWCCSQWKCIQSAASPCRTHNRSAVFWFSLSSSCRRMIWKRGEHFRTCWAAAPGPRRLNYVNCKYFRFQSPQSADCRPEGRAEYFDVKILL